jgi:hypothetical protein
MTSLLTSHELNQCLLLLKNTTILRDHSAGTIVVRDGNEVCLRAMLKSKSMWIVMTYSTTNIKWEKVLK